MKIQVKYSQPVFFKTNQDIDEMFRFCGTISLPALPTVGTKLWEFLNDDPDTATIENVRLVPEEENPKRLTYEIEILSEIENVTEWRSFDSWFRKKMQWILGLGLILNDWPNYSDHDSLSPIDSIEKFNSLFTQQWYEKIVSDIQD